MGVFEFDQFASGTQTLAKAIADSPAFSIAGGGDTLAAIAKFGVTDKISYISTGGGAFLNSWKAKNRHRRGDSGGTRRQLSLRACWPGFDVRPTPVTP